ncbi:MAG: ABC transporter permease [Steroidobacteraceae bacterium]|jgi:putative ABC transport system permease protein|nr:ABC transporter permease [Steroidobacteraceae bacterium]
MSATVESRAGLTPGSPHWLAIVRAVSLAQLREQPGRVAITVLVIALGVALAAAVFFVNGAALGQFSHAARELVGEADVVVRGGRAGFPEGEYARLAQLPGVREASPALDVDAALAGGGRLRIVGMDAFRAGMIQPRLYGELNVDLLTLFAPDAIVLSAQAARELEVGEGGVVSVRVGTQALPLRVVAVLSRDVFPQRLGIMDISTAQWLFGRVGTISRVDLRLEPNVDRERFRDGLRASLPPGVEAIAPEVERTRAETVTRSYRVNLNMLALVALLTGAFLVFSTQALSVLRRRTALALLRALGLRRGELQALLVLEGTLLGALGSLLGVALGYLIASALVTRLGGDLGGGYLESGALTLTPQPLAMLAFFLLGTGFALAGSWVPAREAALRSPARALKAGDVEPVLERLRSPWPGLGLLALGTAVAFVPPVGGVPVFGYLAITLLLFGGVLLVPRVSAFVLSHLPATGRVPVDVGLAQLRGSAGQSSVSLATVIVSFSLMVAMAIMVFSFRESFIAWLDEVLPADVQLRASTGADTAFWTPDVQARLAAVPGVGRIEFHRVQHVLLAPDRPPVSVIARDVDFGNVGAGVPLLEADPARHRPDRANAWVSEAIVDLYGLRIGDELRLPLGGRYVPVTIAGVWRDYARSFGAVVVDRDWYVRQTNDRLATEAAVWLAPGAEPDRVIEELRARLEDGRDVEIMTSGGIRELSLRIFDRAFTITYALEAVAVLIGLVGIAFAASSQALARRGEFAMLRHVGLQRHDVIRMLAAEGTLTGAIGVVYGLALGFFLSLVLVYVVNRQSFNWSLDLSVPWLQLAVLSAVLILAAAITATVAGRAAVRGDVVRAVREDW